VNLFFNYHVRKPTLKYSESEDYDRNQKIMTGVIEMETE